MKSYILFVLINVLVFLSACNNDDTDRLFPEYSTSQALLSDVTISLGEQTQLVDSVQAEDEGIYLYIETTESYTYCNYGILRSTFQTGDTLLIRLEDLITPGVFISPAGPATTNVKIPENTKRIVFLRGNDSDSFNLTIEKDALVLQPLYTSFTETEHVIYLRNTETAP